MAVAERFGVLHNPGHLLGHLNGHGVVRTPPNNHEPARSITVGSHPALAPGLHIDVIYLPLLQRALRNRAGVSL